MCVAWGCTFFLYSMYLLVNRCSVLVMVGGDDSFQSNYLVHKILQVHTLCCHFAESLKEFEEAPHSTGSGISEQANKIVLTIVAILSVWAGNILP